MITTEEFKKLVRFQECGNYNIYCMGDLVGISYDSGEYDPEDEMTEEYRCSFTFNDDKYDTVFSLCQEEYRNAKWTVERVESVDWRNTEPMI
jgi:hypothetical protein